MRSQQEKKRNLFTGWSFDAGSKKKPENTDRVSGLTFI
jgi:hypothetical protein